MERPHRTEREEAAYGRGRRGIDFGNWSEGNVADRDVLVTRRAGIVPESEKHIGDGYAPEADRCIAIPGIIR
jgi:hypothetical protein